MRLTHSPHRYLSTQLASAPTTYIERELQVLEMFRGCGANPRRRTIRDSGGNLLDECNIEVALPGDRRLAPIYLTAHHDHVPTGHGVVDNWSGVVALVQLFERFQRVPLLRPAVLVSFALEEPGAIGSEHFVKQLGDRTVHANVNLECLGPGPLHYTTYGDPSGLTPLGIPKAPYHDLLSDARSFYRIGGHRAIGFDGIAGVRRRIIHTVNDTIEAINMDHYTHSLDQIEAYVRQLDSPSENDWVNGVPHRLNHRLSRRHTSAPKARINSPLRSSV